MRFNAAIILRLCVGGGNDGDDWADGPTPPSKRSTRKKMSTEEIARVVSIMSSHVEKTAAKQQEASAKVAAQYGKRLRMQQIYKGGVGRNNGQ